jgi:hypothetical protein
MPGLPQKHQGKLGAVRLKLIVTVGKQGSSRAVQTVHQGALFGQSAPAKRNERQR